MAPSSTHLRKSLPRDKFPLAFSTTRTTTYYDSSTRGPGTHTIRSIAWNPTGVFIATGSQDRTLRIWNPEKKEIRHSTELKGHTGAIERVVWNPTKEAELASVSLDGTVRFWDVRSKRCFMVVELGARGLSLCWADDGQLCVAGKGDRADEEALVPILVPGYTALPALVQGGQVNQVAICPTREDSDIYYLCITSGNGQVKIATYPKPTSPLFPAAEMTVLYSFQVHTYAALCLALSPNGRWLATGGSDAMTMLWDTQEWVCRHALDHAHGTVRGVSFSFDGAYLAAASEDTEDLDIIHVESGETVARVPLKGNQAGMPRVVVAGKGTDGAVTSEGVGTKGIGKGLIKVSDVGSINAALCVAWHPQRYWLAYSGDGDSPGLRVIGANSGTL